MSKSKWYIKSKSCGYFVGHCLGLAFFESSIECGDLDPREEPVEFDSQEEAQAYLDSWEGGTADCFVTNEAPQ